MITNSRAAQGDTNERTKMKKKLKEKEQWMALVSANKTQLQLEMVVERAKKSASKKWHRIFFNWLFFVSLKNLRLTTATAALCCFTYCPTNLSSPSFFHISHFRWCVCVCVCVCRFSFSPVVIWHNTNITCKLQNVSHNI